MESKFIEFTEKGLKHFKKSWKVKLRKQTKSFCVICFYNLFFGRWTFCCGWITIEFYVNWVVLRRLLGNLKICRLQLTSICMNCWWYWPRASMVEGRFFCFDQGLELCYPKLLRWKIEERFEAEIKIKHFQIAFFHLGSSFLNPQTNVKDCINWRIFLFFPYG